MDATPAPAQDIRRTDLTLAPSVGLHAVRLIEWAREAGPDGLVFVADGERRAEQLAAAVRGLAPELKTLLLPPWDCLPYDSASPSLEVMGRRVAVLRQMAELGASPRVLITSPAAAIQRVPPHETWKGASFSLRSGEPFSQEALEIYLRRAGYILDERVDEPGEVAIRGRVIDIFPSNSASPYRAERDGGLIVAIRSYDPVSQRTDAEVESLLLEPASEIVLPDPLEGEAPAERFAGMEHRLPEFYPHLETIFDAWPHATVAMEARAEERRRFLMEQVADAYESRMKLRGDGSAATGGSALAPKRLFIEDGEWQDCVFRHPLTILRAASDDEGRTSTVPRFVSASKPSRALADFVAVQIAAGRKIVLMAATRQDLSRMRRRVQPLQTALEPVKAWEEVLAGKPETWFTLQADLRNGFLDERNRVAVIAAADLLGSRAGSEPARGGVGSTIPQLMETGFRIGDAVIHLDHGIGVLKGIETISVADAEAHDTIKLGYADEAKLMVPVAEIGHIWRYGSTAEALTLDKLNGSTWPTRRERVETEIREAAKHLTEMVEARRSLRLEPLAAPSRDYERFVARFPFLETQDQLRAIEDVLSDLASGYPMDRLVCGDVGFGKTEVALRAAAAVALAGKQVAVVAPTTVLARQHLRTFQRRFAGLGVETAHLSRLVTPAEARSVKKRLADGTIRVVIGTHALAGKGVTFKDLGLVIIDEEQRFGTAHKTKLRAMAAGGHVLTLTATPIPRTLQTALVGLQEISVIATPPARRQPIRTFLIPFDPATVRQALMRERRRGGQSFVVCSRIEDIAPMREQLEKLVPELNVMVAHGQMPPDETDEVMVRFADGEGDVLLATNIIESGLDVPRANTMLVWRADRFGLSQLHQLRGRVGRGRIRGAAYLLTEPDLILPKATEKRLRTLEALDRLGAGFAISAQDLDLRGAGALLGEEQAGHIKLVGADLYQHMLKRALRGEALDDDWVPELNLGLTGMIPEGYVNEPEVRIDLYARLARPGASETIEDLGAEIEDRFGPMPESVQTLLGLAHLKRLCFRFGVARIDAGPQAIALTFRPGAAEKLALKALIQEFQGDLHGSGERLIWSKPIEQAEERQKRIVELLERFGE